MRIAILEENSAELAHLVQLLSRQHLASEEYIECAPFTSELDLQQSLRAVTYDLLVLGWNDTDLKSLRLLQWLRRERGNEIPVMMVSLRQSEQDVADALRHGADDFMSAPLRSVEFVARVQRLLARRRGQAQRTVEAHGPWTLDRAALRVYWSPPCDPATRHEMRLSDREMRLVLALFRNAGHALSRDYLLEQANYAAEEISTRLLDSHIYRLRNKLQLAPERGVLLQTLYGRGYRLQLLDAPPRPAPLPAPVLDTVQEEG